MKSIMQKAFHLGKVMYWKGFKLGIPVGVILGIIIGILIGRIK